MNKCALLASVATVAFFGAAGTSFAQTTRGEDPGVLEEVIVTAQKRAENLQDTPVAVTAVSQDDLQRQGVQDFTTLTKVAPEVMATSTTAQIVISIRGVRPSTFSPTSDSPNAVHIDGAYVSRFYALSGLFFDLERIEVLSGPQGTLYGRNSVGGTVNLITAKPKPEVGGWASLEYGNYNQIVAQGAVNLPLSETLAVRAAFRHYSHDGYYTDTGTDDAAQDSVRFSAQWEPTPDDTFLFSTDYEQVGGKGGSSNIINGQLSPGGAATAPTANIVKPSDARMNHALIGDGDLFKTNVRGWGWMTQYDHDFGFATLTAQASARANTADNRTGTIRGWQQTAFNPSATRGTSRANWNSQEVRLTSNASTPLQWVVGAYRFEETTTGGGNITFASNTSQVVLNNIANPSSADVSYAVFGQGVYTPSALPNLHVTLGGRYNTEEKSGDGYTQTGGVILYSFPTTSASWDAFTYRLNVAYDITPESMVYGGVSTGFKSGGFAYGPVVGYQPETVTAYEVGSKNRFFDNRLQVNLAAWHYDYEDVVVTTFTPYTIGTQSFNLLSVLNAATAQNTGQSIAVDWLISPTDIFSINAQHLDAHFDNYDLRPIGQLDYSNTPYGYAPEWVSNLTYNHIFHGLRGEWNAEAAVQFNGDRLLIAQAVAGSPQDIHSGSYTTADLSLRYQPDEADWTITGYVRNLTDELYLVNAAYVSNATVPYRYNTGTYGAPRTFGVIFNAKFN